MKVGSERSKTPLHEFMKLKSGPFSGLSRDIDLFSFHNIPQSCRVHMTYRVRLNPQPFSPASTSSVNDRYRPILLVTIS